MPSCAISSEGHFVKFDAILMVLICSLVWICIPMSASRVPKSHPSTSGPWKLNLEKIWTVVSGEGQINFLIPFGLRPEQHIWWLAIWKIIFSCKESRICRQTIKRFLWDRSVNYTSRLAQRTWSIQTWPSARQISQRFSRMRVWCHCGDIMASLLLSSRRCVSNLAGH